MTKSGCMKPYFADSIIQSQPRLSANRLLVPKYGPVYASLAFCGPTLGFLSQTLLLPHPMVTSLIGASSMPMMHDSLLRRHTVLPTRILHMQDPSAYTPIAPYPRGPGRRRQGI